MNNIDDKTNTAELPSIDRVIKNSSKSTKVVLLSIFFGTLIYVSGLPFAEMHFKTREASSEYWKAYAKSGRIYGNLIAIRPNSFPSKQSFLDSITVLYSKIDEYDSLSTYWKSEANRRGVEVKKSWFYLFD